MRKFYRQSSSITVSPTKLSYQALFRIFTASNSSVRHWKKLQNIDPLFGIIKGDNITLGTVLNVRVKELSSILWRHWIKRYPDVGCLPFDRKFRIFRMEGKRWGHFSEIPTKNWGVHFEVVRSFRLVRTKRECCLPFTNFLVPSRSQTHATQIRPFLDSNSNGCGNSAVTGKSLTIMLSTTQPDFSVK